MLNVPTFEQNQLFKQSQLKKLQNNTYLSDKDNENFIYLKDKFFYGELEEKAQLLNVGSGLFSAVSDTIAYYVGEPSLEIEFDTRKYIEDYIALGFATIGLARKDGKLITQYQPAQNYWNDEGTDNILRMYTKENENMVEIYMLVTEYGIGYITNKLFLIERGTMFSDVEVGLETLPQTKDLEPYIATGIEGSALIVVKDDEMEQYPISMIEKIKQLVYAVDRQVIMQHTQFLQNVESFVLFKGIRRPQKLLTEYESGKKIDYSMVGKVINGDEDSSIEFINNTNDLITQSIEENENNVRRVSAMTDVPLDFLGIKENDGAIGANSRTLKQGSFIKRVEGIRDLFDKYIMKILELMNEDVEYSRPEVLAKSDNELVEELKVARETMLLSQYEAIKRYNGYDDEQTELEMERIVEEKLLASNIKEDEIKGDSDTEPKEDTNDDQTKD